MQEITRSRYHEPKKPKKCKLSLSTRDRWIPVLEKAIRKRKYGRLKTCPLCQEIGVGRCFNKTCNTCICKFWLTSLGENVEMYTQQVVYCSIIFEKGLSWTGQTYESFDLGDYGNRNIIRNELRSILDWIKD